MEKKLSIDSVKNILTIGIDKAIYSSKDVYSIDVLYIMKDLVNNNLKEIKRGVINKNIKTYFNDLNDKM